MGKKLIKDSTLSGIAEAIRAKDGNNSPMTPLEMAGRIAGIPTGGGGVELPELDNPAGSSEVLKGYQAINQAGAVVNGSHVCPTVADLTKDANAGAGDILNGKTAYVNGEKVTGSHVCPDVLDTTDATATPDQVAAGATYYAGGEKKTGSVYTVSTNLNELKTPSVSSDRITLSTTFSDPTLFAAGSTHNVRAYLNNFGDATAADVASGKTFTSEAGVKVVGTAGSPDFGLKLVKTVSVSNNVQSLDRLLTSVNWIEFVANTGMKCMIPYHAQMENTTYDKGCEIGLPRGSNTSWKCYVYKNGNSHAVRSQTSWEYNWATINIYEVL